MKTTFLYSLLLLVGVCTCQSASGDGGVTDTNTNWLSECDTDRECDGFACLCGVCTRSCSSASSCSDLSSDAECREGSCGETICVASDTETSDDDSASDDDAGGDDGGNADDTATNDDDVTPNSEELDAIRADAMPNESTDSCEYAWNDLLPLAYQNLEVRDCDVSFAAPLPNGACDSEVDTPCSMQHARECGFDPGETWQPQECGPCDAWLCDCLGGTWTCWLSGAAGSGCGDSASPAGANCGIPPLPSCDDVIRDIDEAITAGAECTGDEDCFAMGDYDCNGEPDLIAASKRNAYDVAVGWVEPALCYEAIGCDAGSLSSESAACIAGRCELVESPTGVSNGGAPNGGSTSSDGGSMSNGGAGGVEGIGGAPTGGTGGGANQCRLEAEVCLERQGPSSEVTVIDEPCCDGLTCDGCVAGNNLERCTCTPELIVPQPCGSESEPCERSCGSVCTIFEVSNWCSPEMGFVDETLPIEWVCGAPETPRQALMDSCVNLGTGADRWCCPPEFDPVCAAE